MRRHCRQCPARRCPSSSVIPSCLLYTAAFAKPVNYIYHIGQYLPDWHPWENYKNFFVGDRRTGGVREIFGIDLPWLLDAFGPVKHVYAEKDKLSGLEIDYPDLSLIHI